MDEFDIKDYLESNLRIKFSTENHDASSNCLAVELWLGDKRIDYDWISPEQMPDWFY